jgi:hypothetical protein
METAHSNNNSTLVISITVGYGAAPKRTVGEKDYVFVAPFNDPSATFLTGAAPTFSARAGSSETEMPEACGLQTCPGISVLIAMSR